MSVAKEKDKPPESASNRSVTDVSRFPIEDEDREGKYEMPGGGGGTVYRVVLLGNMFESFYALFGLIAVVTGMFTTWAITNYAVSHNRAGSDEDEFGTDIDNPERLPTKDERRRRNSSDGPDDSGIGTAAENSTSLPTKPKHPNQAERVRRRLGSDSESTHSSIDDFADAMDTVQHSNDYPDSGRPRDHDENDFVNLDNDGSAVMQGNRDANVLQSFEDGSLSDDVLVKSESESGSDIGIDEALDDAYAMLDMQDDDTSLNNNANTETKGNSLPTPVDEDVNLSLTHSEESTPEPSSLPESNNRRETLDETEEGSSVDKDITTVQTSIEYDHIETHDVPNAAVVKNALDDEIVEDGSDDTTTSSDADTVKDAGADIQAREHDLHGDERTQIENVVAGLIADEMVSETMGDIDVIEHDLDHGDRTDVRNVVADEICYQMVRDAEEDFSETEHDESREERTDVVNVVADLISSDMVNEASCAKDLTNQDSRIEDDLIQPEVSQEDKCWLRNDPESDETSDSKKQVNVTNVVAESLANEMVLEILDELANNTTPTLADDDSELPQTNVGKDTDYQSYRRVSDGPIPQIRIDSFDDDGEAVEVDVVEAEFASPDWEFGNEIENTSALPDIAYDNTVPHDHDDEIAKEAYKADDHIPHNDENQNQTKPEIEYSIESDYDVQIVVNTSQEQPTDVRDLLTKLTGEDISSRGADEECEMDSDPKLGMTEIMVTLGSKNFEDHIDDDAAERNNERETIDEEIITSATARPVECSNINAFCSRPQEPTHSDSENDVGISVHQDLQTEGSSPRDPDSEDQVFIAKVTVPKTNLRDVLSSLGGEGSYEAEKQEDGEEETEDLKIEDFLLAEVKGLHLIDSEDSNKHLYKGKPVHEDSVMPASASVDDSKDVDYFSNLNGHKVDDQEQKTPSHDEVVVPQPLAARDAGPDLDVSSILSNVPVAPPSNVTPRKVFDDDVVATDVRKTTNGRVNLKSLLKSLGGDLTVDVDLNDSDVSEASPQRKKVITDEMVREAIQYLLQQPFMHSYGMYDSQDSLFYNTIFDDSLGGRTFALVRNLHGKGLTPEKKSTVFALVSSPSKENLAVDDDDDPSDVDEPIFPDQRDEEECEINFNELFANLERRSTEGDQDKISPKQEVNEDYIADNSWAVEEAVPEQSSERDIEGYPAEVRGYPADARGYPADACGYPTDVRGYPDDVRGYSADVQGYPSEVQGYPTEVRDYPAEVQGYPDDVRGYPDNVRGYPSEVQGYPTEVRGYRAEVQGYAEVEDAVPEKWGPDTISYSDDDSSSVSSSDTSGTYILDNQMGLVEEDEEEEEHEQPRFKQPSFPRDTSHDTMNISHDTMNPSRDIPSYHGYDNEPYEVPEEEEEEEEEPEPPQTSRMFFITSAMLTQMSQEQNGESSSDDDYERRGRQSDSPGSSSSGDYLEAIPAGYGPNGDRVWPHDKASTAYHQYRPEDNPTGSYPTEVPTAEYDYDDETKFRPISGRESSVEPTPRYPNSNAPKDNSAVTHPSQNGHGLSDYDSSPELLEIERQRQKLFPQSPHDYNSPPEKSEHLQNGDNMDYLPERLLPAVEPTVTMTMKYPDETAPTRAKDMFDNIPNDFKPIPEPTITRDMNVPEQLQPVFARPVFHQGLTEDDPRTNPSAQSYESLDARDPSLVEPNMVSNEYARTNGHHEPLSQSEDSMWSHSDYRGYSGSSEDGEFDVYDDTSFASGERMFALVGLRSADSTPVALSVNASIEVYRAEEHMETQMSLHSYEINKGIAGPDGKMVKLQEQSFSFEQRSDIFVESTDSPFEAVLSESVSDSAGEQFSQLGLEKNYSGEVHEQSFASAEHHSDNAEDSIDSPGDVNETEGFSMNDTVTADFTGDQFAYRPEQQGNDYNSEDLKLDLPFDSAGEEMSEREGLQRQVESLSELLSEKTLDMQRFKDEYPFLDRIMANPKDTVAGYEEGQLIGLLETYRQLEEDVLELMNIYKETKTQLTELDRMERS